jgi:hypothetical protein
MGTWVGRPPGRASWVDVVHRTVTDGTTRNPPLDEYWIVIVNRDHVGGRFETADEGKAFAEWLYEALYERPEPSEPKIWRRVPNRPD